MIIAICVKCQHEVTSDETGPCHECGSKNMRPYFGDE